MRKQAHYPKQVIRLSANSAKRTFGRVNFCKLRGSKVFSLCIINITKLCCNTSENN